MKLGHAVHSQNNNHTRAGEHQIIFNSYCPVYAPASKGPGTWLSAFSPFPTMFSKCILYRIAKGRDWVVELTSRCLQRTHSEEFADGDTFVTKIEFDFGKMEKNINVGKGQSANMHFLLFPQRFPQRFTLFNKGF